MIPIAPWPRWRILAFMTALSRLAGLSAELYLTQLMTCAAIAVHRGEN